MNAHSAPSASSASQDTLARSRRPPDSRLFVAGGLACLAVVTLLVAWKVLSTSDNDESIEQKSDRDVQSDVTSKVSNDTTNVADASSAKPFTLIDDDGSTLWVSPTQGPPLDLAYLPPGLQIIVALRRNALEDHHEGTNVFAALGPMGQRGMAKLDEILANPESVEQLVVGLSATSDGRWQCVLVARLGGSSTAAQHLATNLPDADEKTHGENKYLVDNDRAYFAPAADRQLMVVAPVAAITEIIDLQGQPPPLRRQLERLVSHTDAARHFTVVVAPNFLFSEGQGMFAGQMAPLREPLFWFLGDEFGAAGLSMHWDDDFFVELLAVPTLDTSPERAFSVLTERVAQIPDKLDDYIAALRAQPYGRRILARFPAMVRTLSAYTRSGFESDHAVLRCYLPEIAGHNLLLGAELTLAEAIASKRASISEAISSATVTEVTAPSEPFTVRERLERRTSLSFPRDTLEAALEQLSRDIGADIVIAGADLQAEGITKNQSFGIDVSNRPAEEILVEILRLANPDKSATRPHDLRQKLIYVITAKPGNVERIVITTRAGAAARGEELPVVFRPN